MAMRLRSNSMRKKKMTRDLVVIGCGGLGRELVSIVDSINISGDPEIGWNLLGFLDDYPSDSNVARAARIHLPILGPVAASSLHSKEQVFFIVGIGDGGERRNAAKRAEALGWIPAVLVDPSARVGRDVRIGDGTVIAAFVHVTTNVDVGRHVVVDRGSHIGHDSVLGDFVTVHPMSVVSGNCTLRSGARLGTHSTLLPGITIGADATVGAGACVTKDVAKSTVVRGVPAR